MVYKLRSTSEAQSRVVWSKVIDVAFRKLEVSSISKALDEIRFKWNRTAQIEG